MFLEKTRFKDLNFANFKCSFFTPLLCKISVCLFVYLFVHSFVYFIYSFLHFFHASFFPHQRNHNDPKISTINPLAQSRNGERKTKQPMRLTSRLSNIQMDTYQYLKNNQADYIFWMSQGDKSGSKSRTTRPTYQFL